MTGSGATCFGVFDTYSHMKKAEVKLKNKNNNWWIASAKTLNYI
jgi:4-diphosphocytidyl-2C-methyl-D-erythritol kinase